MLPIQEQCSWIFFSVYTSYLPLAFLLHFNYYITFLTDPNIMDPRPVRMTVPIWAAKTYRPTWNTPSPAISVYMYKSFIPEMYRYILMYIPIADQSASPTPPYMPIQGTRRSNSSEDRKKKSKDKCTHQWTIIPHSIQHLYTYVLYSLDNEIVQIKIITCIDLFKSFSHCIFRS